MMETNDEEKSTMNEGWKQKRKDER